MGFGINNFKIVAQYAEKCGVKSILQTKPVVLNKAGLDGLQRFSKREIPKYLYHMTTPANYEKMLASGTINATRDSLFGNGVFMFDVKNLFKNWNGSKAWGAKNLKFKLINHARKQGSDVVVLRIPTGQINKGLRIRSQEELFDYYKTPQRFLLDKHLSQGAKAQDRNLFGGQSLEYVYPKNIEMKYIEKLGEVNIGDLQKMPDYDSFRPLQSFFKTIFKGHPEQKTAETLLNC